MIPTIANIRKAIYCLNKRLDLLEGGEYSNTVTELSNKVAALESLLDDDALNPTAAIDKFNEIVAFLNSIDNTETLLELLRDVVLLLYQQNYVTVLTYADLPTTGSAGTIYRVSNYNGSTNQIDTTSYSEYVWNNSDYTLLCVKSLIGEVFDISEYHGDLTYLNLEAALDSNNGGGVPQSLQKGGMSVKFVQSSDNKYVQYRLMSNEFSDNPIFWQGVDDILIDGSKNLIENRGVAVEFNGNSIEQPTAQTMITGYINSDGTFNYNTTARSTIIDLSKAFGCHITETTSSIIQYAFIKDYTQERVTFVNGGSRITGTLNNTEIPSDANYLYLYIGNSTVIPVVKLEDGKQGINKEIEDINNAINDIESDIDNISQQIAPMGDIVEAVDKLNWTAPLYVFTESEESNAVLNNNIVLSSNGDSIEFKLSSCGYYNFTNLKGYAFARGNNSSHIAIGLVKEYISVRSDDNTWVFSAINGNYSNKTIKISYETNNICLYVDGTLVSTYNGQKTLTIVGFGNGSDYSVYWDGSITNLKVNGISYNLTFNAILNNVDVFQDTSFLTSEEKNNNNPKMMFKKDSTSAIVFFKNDKGTYFGIPLNFRYKTYTVGQYPSFYDNWGVGQMKEYEYDGGMMVEKHTIFKGGEAELAVQLPRGDGESGNVYVGGSAHGFENIITADGNRSIVMLVNGVWIGEAESFELSSIDKFEVFQNTELCQAYTNTNPWANVIKHWIFTKDKLVISSKLKVLRSLTLATSQFGMFCVYRHLDGDSQKDYLAGKAIRDDKQFTIFDIEDGWWNISPSLQIGIKDHDCSKISVWGDAYYGFSMGVEDASLKANGGMFISTNGGMAYNKIYFDLTGSYTPQVDEELYATQIWYFNSNKKTTLLL